MIRKVWFPVILLIVIASNLKSSLADGKLLDEDIEETSELVVNHLAPLLELNGYSLEDLPNQLKLLTAKYYLIFSRGVEPLDTLEKMLSDYIIIQSSQHIVEEEFQEYIEHFVQVNQSNNKKVLEKFVSNIVGSFDLHLQVVSPSDGVKFLLYQEAYPDIVELISLMVRKHYDAYLKERAKDEGHPAPTSNPSDKGNEDKPHFDLFELMRKFVATHGRLELVKRFLNHLDQYMPPFEQANTSESTLDYLDDLQAFFEVKSNILWDFMKAPSYTATTDEWITRVEELLRDFLTIIPLQEILNFFDVLALNANDRRAFVIMRYERYLWLSDELLKKENPHLTVANAKDIFDFVRTKAINAFTTIQKTLRDTVTGASGEVSQEVFLEYIDELLAPYDLSTSDMSKEMLAIVSRAFTRINAIEGQSLSDSEKEVLKLGTLSTRKNLERLRDALRALIPEKSESNHIQLEGLLQSMVNKYGALALQIETSLVKFFNYRIDKPGDKEIVEGDISKFAQQLDDMASSFEGSGKTPSTLLNQRLSDLVQIIDGLVMFTTL